MFGLGLPEILVIVVIAALVFGGRRLPELGKALGGSLKAFKKGLAGEEDRETRDVEPLDPKDDRKKPS